MAIVSPCAPVSTALLTSVPLRTLEQSRRVESAYQAYVAAGKTEAGWAAYKAVEADPSPAPLRPTPCPSRALESNLPFTATVTAVDAGARTLAVETPLTELTDTLGAVYRWEARYPGWTVVVTSEGFGSSSAYPTGGPEIDDREAGYEEEADRETVRLFREFLADRSRVEEWGPEVEGWDGSDSHAAWVASRPYCEECLDRDPLACPACRAEVEADGMLGPVEMTAEDLEAFARMEGRGDREGDWAAELAAREEDHLAVLQAELEAETEGSGRAFPEWLEEPEGIEAIGERAWLHLMAFGF